MGDSNNPEGIDLAEAVRKNSEALQQLQCLPTLVQELCSKVSRVKSSDLIEPPPSMFSPVIPGNDQSTVQNDFETLMGGVAKSNTSEAALEDGELDEALTGLLADVEKGVEYGGPLIPHVRESFFKTISRPLSKETATALRNNVKIPENCKLLMPPKMNSEVWKCLPSHARIDDLKKQQAQTGMAYGISALAQIANTIVKRSKELPQDLVSELLKITLDASNILGDQFQEMNSRRRMEPKRYICSQYSGICSKEYPPSELLFGNDMADALKESKATSALMRPQGKGNRFTPYNRTPFQKRASSGQFNQQSLNSFRSPSSFPKRNSWSNQQKGTQQFNRGSRQPQSSPNFQPQRKY